VLVDCLFQKQQAVTTQKIFWNFIKMSPGNLLEISLEMRTVGVMFIIVIVLSGCLWV